MHAIRRDPEVCASVSESNWHSQMVVMQDAIEPSMMPFIKDKARLMQNRQRTGISTFVFKDETSAGLHFTMFCHARGN